MGPVLGRKPEHQTLCFSVLSGCTQHWEVPCVCVRRLRLRSFHRRIGSPLVFCNVWLFNVVHVCVVLCVSWIRGCRSHWNFVAWLLSFGFAMCVDRCRFAMWCCKMHSHGCMNVAWGLCWGGSRSTKACVFPCKVAAGGDERYLLCAAVAPAVVPSMIVSSSVFTVFCNEWLFLCA